ncbi:UNVERIFIED_CONTAM: putative LRR receptor-like serine/threonine-protein kinase [Sesamum radiatum]|uniref:LRR receptor-like serine/threonine-protein kinase n=1 Tax=Sesamum radiatum TaxID=300843 RepID=A0AAW2K4S8_SESRA
MAAAAAPLMSRRRLLVLCFLAAFGQLMDTAGAQNRTAATTDPLEARALNAMFARWRISATNNWNISGELCSGVAIDDTEIITLNPGIKCDCTFNNRTTCRITALRVYELDVTGPIPDELWNLTYMDDLSFGENALSGEVPRELGRLTDLRSLSFNRNNLSGPLPAELGNLSRLAQIGYVAPEYAMLGRLTEKADTFSFGVVALEIISGRPNSDLGLEDDMIYLLEWVWNLHKDNRDMELVDPTLHQYDANAVQRVISVALLCTQASPASRPPMSRVVAMLSGDIEVPSVTSKPGYLTDWNFSDMTTFMMSATEDASTSKSNTSYMNSKGGTTTTTDYANSHENPVIPILEDRIGSGR